MILELWKQVFSKTSNQEKKKAIISAKPAACGHSQQRLADGEHIISEMAINKWLAKEFIQSRIRGGQRRSGLLCKLLPERLIRFLSVKLEEENIIKVTAISSVFFQIHIEAVLADIWHDAKTSTVSLQINSFSIFDMSFLPAFLSRRLAYITLAVIGFLFNPLTVKEGVYLRCKGEEVEMDLHGYFNLTSYDPIVHYTGDAHASGFFIIGASTAKGMLKLRAHNLSEPVKDQTTMKMSTRRTKHKEKWIRADDILGLSIIAVSVSLLVAFLHPLFHLDVQFSFSWYFVSSILITIGSVFLLNIPRWLYQLLSRKTGRTLEYAGEAIGYHLDRCKRDVELAMGNIQVSQKKALEELLLQMSRKRAMAVILEERLDRIHRYLKLKYSLAYLVTIICEFIVYQFCQR